MPEIHIPLTKGLHEEIDAKLLPQGALTAAENVRFRKDGRLGLRYGYDYVTGSPSGVIASSPCGSDGLVLVKARVDLDDPAAAYFRRGDGTFSSANYSRTLGDVAAVSKWAHTRATTSAPTYRDATTDNHSRLWFAYVDPATIPSISISCVDPTTHQVFWSTTVSSASGLANPHLVTVSDTAVACLYYDATDSALHVLLINPDTFVTSTVSGPTVLDADAGASADMCVGPTGYALISVQNDTDSFRVTKMDAAGALTTVFTQDLTDPTTSISYITSSSSIGVLCLSGGDVYYTIRDSAGTLVQDVTALDTTSTVHGKPIAGANQASAQHVFLWNCDQATFPVLRGATASGTAHAHNPAVNGVFAITRPFTLGSACLVWAADHARYTGMAPGATAYLVSVGESTYGHLEAYAEHLTIPLTSVVMTNQRVTVPTLTSTDTPSQYDAYALLPTMANAKEAGIDVVKASLGAWMPQMQTAHINGETVLAGALMRETDDRELVECGLWNGPDFVTATAGSSPTGVTAGDHSWVVVWEWYDRAGRRHQSAPSLPVSDTVVGGMQSLTISFPPPPFSAKSGITANVYRTLVGGGTYYLVNSTTNITATAGRSLVSFVDVYPDVTIATHGTLYTQGERGAISGLLPNDPPPACRYLWAGADRLIAGGLEDPTAVQWSKLAYPGEGMSWTIDKAFRANVDGVVTGVAQQDGVWIIFTHDGIWTVSGDGPDDNGGGGYFGAPVRQPSAIGCKNGHSIMATQNGLIFQGTDDHLWLLPRGGTQPQPAGLAVRGVLDSYPNITACAYVPSEQCAYWACANAARSAGRLVVYDTRLGEWYVDTYSTLPAKTLTVYDDALLIDGQYAQTPAAYTDDADGASTTSITGTITTGDIRPFGPTGWGRLRWFELLGEYRAGGVLIYAYVSYDSGISWPDYYYWTPGTDAVVTRYGTSPPVVSLSGTASDSYNTPITTVVIDITTAGGLGVAKFRWSVNGGQTWAASNVTVQATRTLGTTGLTATFTDATYNADNYYTSSVYQHAGDALVRQFGPSVVRNCSYRVKITVTNSYAASTPAEGVVLNALSAEVFQAAGLKRLGAAERK